MSVCLGEVSASILCLNPIEKRAREGHDDEALGPLAPDSPNIYIYIYRASERERERSNNCQMLKGKGDNN